MSSNMEFIMEFNMNNDSYFASVEDDFDCSLFGDQATMINTTITTTTNPDLVSDSRFQVQATLIEERACNSSNPGLYIEEAKYRDDDDEPAPQATPEWTHAGSTPPSLGQSISPATPETPELGSDLWLEGIKGMFPGPGKCDMIADWLPSAPVPAQAPAQAPVPAFAPAPAPEPTAAPVIPAPRTKGRGKGKARAQDSTNTGVTKRKRASKDKFQVRTSEAQGGVTRQSCNEVWADTLTQHGNDTKPLKNNMRPGMLEGYKFNSYRPRCLNCNEKPKFCTCPNGYKE